MSTFAADCLPVDDPEPDLDKVQPRARRRCEVDVEPRILLKPGLDLGESLWVAWLHHQVQLPVRVCAVQVAAGTPGTPAGGVGLTAPVTCPGRDLERREQGGRAMPLVIVCALLRVPDSPSAASARSGPAPESRTSRPHSTTAFCGGARYRPTTSVTLPTNSGSVENLNVSDLHGCTCSRHARAIVAFPTLQMRREQPQASA